MPVGRCVAAVALPTALAGGCVTHACPGIIPANQPAIFELSCSPTNLTRVSLFNVDNPSNTCVDAGLDAAVDGEG